MEEILDIDAISFSSYVRHIDRVKRVNEVQHAVSVRAAVNADKKEFKQWLDSMMKDVQSEPDEDQVRRESLAFLRLVGGKGGI